MSLKGREATIALFLTLLVDGATCGVVGGREHGGLIGTPAACGLLTLMEVRGCGVDGRETGRGAGGGETGCGVGGGEWADVDCWAVVPPAVGCLSTVFGPGPVVTITNRAVLYPPPHNPSGSEQIPTSV